jgi:hypoxanthine phosphoribosyltransferase
VVIVEDIIDTGLTIDYIYKSILSHEPASLKIATLLLKEDIYNGNLKIDYIGFRIPNRFVIGYGLDLDGLGRNLPEIYQAI